MYISKGQGTESEDDCRVVGFYMEVCSIVVGYMYVYLDSEHCDAATVCR
jgi:hypothetical protein